MSLPINLDAIFDRNQQTAAAFADMGDGEQMPVYMRDHFYYDVPALIRYVRELEAKDEGQ